MSISACWTRRLARNMTLMPGFARELVAGRRFGGAICFLAFWLKSCCIPRARLARRSVCEGVIG